MKYLTKVPFIRIWANLFIFKGKETAKQYLSDLALYTLFSIVLIVVWQLYFTPLMPTMDAAFVSTFVICYIVVIPLISMTSRRFYTVGLPWGLSFLILVPLLGYFWTAIVSLSANSAEESQIKITKNRVKDPIIAASIASPPASFASAIVLLIFLVILSFYIPYHIHRPAVLNRTSDIFEDANGKIYCVQGDWLYYFDESDNKTPHLFDRTDGNGEWLNPHGLIRDDNYFYYFFEDGNSGGQTNYWIKIFNHKFELQETVILPDDMFVWGKCVVEGKVYYVLKTGYIDKLDMYCYDTQTKETRLIFENIETDTRVIDGENELYYNRKYNIQTLTPKVKLDYWWDDKLDNSHLFFEDTFDLYFDNKSIYLTINGEKYTFEKDRNFNEFCSKATLVDNKVIFATYDYIKNKKCGNYSDYYCICNQGKSFLYVLDLDTKELNLMDEYEAGTFLIDYDLEGAKYYYDGGLYINNVFYRECEKIEPGPIEIKRGEGYFRFEERKLDYGVSYYKGEFYGI